MKIERIMNVTLCSQQKVFSNYFFTSHNYELQYSHSWGILTTTKLMSSSKQSSKAKINRAKKKKKKEEEEERLMSLPSIGYLPVLKCTIYVIKLAFFLFMHLYHLQGEFFYIMPLINSHHIYQIDHCQLSLELANDYRHPMFLTITHILPHDVALCRYSF